MRPLLLQPIPGKNGAPFYAKLRAEGDESLLATGSGSLYLGFHLDPLYGVHWNNEVDALEFEVKSEQGVTITPAWGQGPKVTEAADADPRYFACDDDNTFCIPVSQGYHVRLEADPDGGTVMDRSSFGGARRPGAGQP
jgi:hypothetical protein